jgi:hypothetical protein
MLQHIKQGTIVTDVGFVKSSALLGWGSQGSTKDGRKEVKVHQNHSMKKI